MIPEIRWLDSVWTLFEEIPPRDQIPILDKFELFISFSKMYPVRRIGDFKGCRYFVTGKWIVYYQQTRDAIWIRGLWPAGARSL